MSGNGTITLTHHDATTVLHLAGEIDAALRPATGPTLSAALDAGRPVEVDLRHVTFLDSTGVAFLLRCHRDCAESGLELRVTHVPAAPLRALQALGLEELLLGTGQQAA